MEAKAKEKEEEKLIELSEDCSCPRVPRGTHWSELPDPCEACVEAARLTRKISIRDVIELCADRESDGEYFNKNRWLEWFRGRGCDELVAEAIDDLIDNKDFNADDELMTEYMTRLEWLKHIQCESKA